MVPRWHYNPATGSRGRCRAQEGACPLGRESAVLSSRVVHFTTEEEARRHEEAELAKALGDLPLVVQAQEDEEEDPTVPHRLLTFGLSDALVARYSEGDCWLLAQEVAAGLPGSRLAFLTSPSSDLWEEDEEEERREAEENWSHVVVQREDGTLLDVEGVWQEEDLIAQWGHHHEVRGDLRVDRALSGASATALDRLHAERLATLLLEALRRAEA